MPDLFCFGPNSQSISGPSKRARSSDDLPSLRLKESSVLRSGPAAHSSHRLRPTPGGVGALGIPYEDENRCYRGLSGTVCQIGAAINGSAA